MKRLLAVLSLVVLTTCVLCCFAPLAMGWTPSFGTHTEFGTGSGPFAIAASDFNKDGKADLATADTSGFASILLGLGGGAFGASTDIAAGADTNSIAVGDVNRDGKLDVVVTNDDDSTVSVLLGDGSGGFAKTATDPATGTNPESVAIRDFNGDGKVDLAVANWDDTVTILLGNGKGGFTKTATAYPTGSGPQSLAVADLNGDGKTDLAVANSSDDTVSILRAKGDGTLRAKVDFPTGHTPYTVAVGDFNRDGRTDLATADYGAGTVSVLLNTTKNGVLSFAAAVPLTAGTHPWSVAVADVNSDGRPDLAATDYGTDTLSVFENTGGAQLFGAAIPVATGVRPHLNRRRRLRQERQDRPGNLGLGRRRCQRHAQHPRREAGDRLAQAHERQSRSDNDDHRQGLLGPSRHVQGVRRRQGRHEVRLVVGHEDQGQGAEPRRR